MRRRCERYQTGGLMQDHSGADIDDDIHDDDDDDAYTREAVGSGAPGGTRRNL